LGLSGAKRPPAAKSHLLAAKVYPQDELSPQRKDELFAVEKGQGAFGAQKSKWRIWK
jgi:hypothetical protein